MNISTETIEMFKSMRATNPYNLTCNPYDTQYKGVPCETTPPQNFTELGDTAVCGVLYDLNTLDANQCPTEYSLQTFSDEASAEAAGATVTHYGACGVCSTTQDLASYIENTDLTSYGTKCSFEAGLKDFEAGIRCYQRAGFSRACAVMWVYNAEQTSDYCAGTCASFTFQQRPNNGPPPVCELDVCLDCDETHSGPLFGKVAARTRRRSGLISKIARPCEDILFVDHQNPCDVVQGITRMFEQSDVCQAKEEVGKKPCVLMETDLGLRSYEKPSNGKFFDISLPSLGGDDNVYDTVYGKCSNYNFRKAKDGFWRDIGSDLFGGIYAAAAFCGMISSIIGTTMWIFVWTSFCVAYPKNFWFACVCLFALCGVLEFLTLMFFASDVCKNGCTMGYAAYCAIIAGILWFVTAGFCWKTASKDAANAYTPVSFDIEITEYTHPDGTLFTEKVTTRSNGTSIIERTTLIKRAQGEKENATESAHAGVVAHSAHTGVLSTSDEAADTPEKDEDESSETIDVDDDDDVKKEK